MVKCCHAKIINHRFIIDRTQINYNVGDRHQGKDRKSIIPIIITILDPDYIRGNFPVLLQGCLLTKY